MPISPASMPVSMPCPANQIQKAVQEFLSAHFDVNDWYLGAHVTRLGETLARVAPYIRPADRVLEAGSYGHIPLLVWRLFGPASVYAYGLQAGFIGYGHGALRAEGDPRIEFQCRIEAVNIERERWPQPDDSLDVVLCFEVLEHMREHPAFMVAEANRVLKPGGYFILTTPNSSSYRAIINILYRENPFIYSVYGAERDGMGHIKEYAVNELQLLVKNSGFEVVTHQTFSPYNDEKDSLFPELRVALRKYGLQDELSGSTHFLVARKISRPDNEYYQPLYNITKAWVLTHPPDAAPLADAGPASPAAEDIVASILVPVQGGWQELPPVFQALFDVRASLPNAEIVLIPFQPNPHQIARLNDASQSRRNTRVVMSDPSATFAQALNRAAQTARGQWLIFLESACSPKTGWLRELLKAANREGTGILSAKTLYPAAESINIERIHNCGIVFDIHKRPKPLYQYCLARQPFMSYERELQASAGPLTLIGRELFAAMGGFDETLTSHGMIFDLCFRVRAAGLSIRLVPDCEVYFHSFPGMHEPEPAVLNDAAFMRKWGDQIQADENDHYRRDGLALAPDGCLRVAMVTPLAPQKTGVADYVHELIPSLARLVTLDVFVDGYIPTEPGLLSQHCVRLISDLEAFHRAQPYDQIVYHIGNNSFHTAIYNAAARVGGVMVVHEYDSKGCKAGGDYTPSADLEELRQDFDEWIYLSNNPDVAAAVQSGVFPSAWEHFAKHGCREKRLFTRKQLGITTNKVLWQKLFARAAGVVVHNRHSQTLLQAEFPAMPIAMIPHVLSPKAAALRYDDVAGARRKLGLPEPTFVIGSLGLVQPHKRNHITVQAFARFVEQHPDSLLMLAGDAPDEIYRAYLEQLIQELGVQDRIQFTGWLSDEAFFDWLSAVDVAVNLRYPSRGEESGTLTRILGAGKPAIVSDYAQYADIPDECVIKIPFADEIHTLAETFSMLAGNETMRHKLADNARRHFRTCNAVERVAEKYAAFCRDVRAGPWSGAYDYPDETQAEVLWEMFGGVVNDPARELVLALDRAGVPIRVKPLASFGNSFEQNAVETNRLHELEVLPLAQRFVQVYAGPVARFQRHPEAASAIVITDHFDQPVTEWSAVPADEFWVPSTHSREQLIQRGVPADKINVVPFGVSALAYGTTIHQPRSIESFTFLTMMDWSERSGWEEGLTAFLDEFSGRQDVRLCLRPLPDGSATDGRQAAVHHLTQFARLHPEFRKSQYSQVSVETQRIAQDEMPLVYTLANAYILPYHDSAFGRTLLEAMAIGLPVITSTFGGQRDFVNDTNAFLVTGQNRQGVAGIDNQALRALMREVFDHRLEAQARGICARNAVLQSWTWDHAAAHALRRLEAAYGAALVRPHILRATPSPAPAKVNSTRSLPPAQAFGFNVIGYISGNLGIGVTARNVIQLLLDNGNPVKLLDLDPGLGRVGHDLRFMPYTVTSPEELSHPVTLFVLPPADLAQWLSNAPGCLLSPEHLNAAWSMWELPIVPRAWHEPLQAMDVLIAESDFIRHAFNSSLSGVLTLTATHPLYLPPGIAADRMRFGLPADGVLFITSFEPYSDIQRKNPMAVLEAFQRALDQDTNAHLVIKINNPGIGDQLQPIVQQLRQRGGGSGQIHILAETLSYPDVLSLYASCDVYVSLHRAEGLGLGLMEAMMLGKPVIATAWSGNMTFMNYANSCPVNYRLIPAEGGIPAYMKEMLGMETVWADPDVDEAAAWMRRLADDPKLRADIGRKAADDMRQRQDEARRGRFINELQVIWEHRVFRRGESALRHRWVGWRETGSQLLNGAQEKKVGRDREALQRGELASPPPMSGVEGGGPPPVPERAEDGEEPADFSVPIYDQPVPAQENNSENKMAQHGNLPMVDEIQSGAKIPEGTREGEAAPNDPQAQRKMFYFRQKLDEITSLFKKLIGKCKVEGEAILIRSSGLFKKDWYLKNNSDVEKAKIDPLRHYLMFGAFEGRDPGPQFAGRWYLDAYPDVHAAGINPLVHYLRYGRKEGRLAMPPVDTGGSAVWFKAQDEKSADWVKGQIDILNRKGRYHSIQLPDGRVLDGVQSIEHLKSRIARFPVPQDLGGKRVLDIGAWDGWFSFEMERRGAEVMAVDCVDMEKFRVAHQLLGSKVEYRVLDVDELTPQTVGRFDIVMFLGVLYHLRHPLLALERICQLTRDMALVESFVIDNGLEPGPYRMEFYETDELGGQTDNWYGPTTACLLALCRSAGFARVELGEVVGQRAHVTCYRHWEPPPSNPRAAPPVLSAAINNRDRTNRFPKNKDVYVCCFFQTPEKGLSRSDLRVELDGYGVPALSCTAQGEDGWQANFWMPSGMEPGLHEVRLRTTNSQYGNPVTVEVLPAVNSPLPF